MLQLGHGGLDLAGPGAHRARHRVEGSELVETGSLMRLMAYVSNLKPRSSSNLSMASINPKSPEREIVRADRARQPGSDPTRDVLDQGRVVEDQSLTGVGVGRCLEARP